MNVLSLCDGMSCGQIALNRLGIKPKYYFASEIKKSAVKITKHNYPDTVHIGDIKGCDIGEESKIDFLLAGTPCQNFSNVRAIMGLKKVDGLDGDKSSLFYEALRIKKKAKPKYFIFENVKMKKESEKQLNEYLEVEGVHINSSLFSYQNRERIYWTNIPFNKLIFGKSKSFQDYIGMGNLEEVAGKRTPSRERMWNNGMGRTHQGACRNITRDHVIGALTTKQDRCPNSGLIEYKDFFRYLSRREMEEAQNVPHGYCDSVSVFSACNLLGDGWTVDVIAHILKGM